MYIYDYYIHKSNVHNWVLYERRTTCLSKINQTQHQIQNQQEGFVGRTYVFELTTGT